MKNKITYLLILCLAIGHNLIFAQKNMEEKIDDLTRQIENLRFTLDVISKKADDNLWYHMIDGYGYMDKVVITGPPSKVSNPTAKGAENPLRIWSYVFVPKQLKSGTKVPLIVLVHGGVHGNFGTYHAHIVREFLSQGYAVIAPEYRGSTGYGKGIHQAIDYGGKEIEDTKAARDYMVDNYDFIDASRVGIVGWSHGGLHALMGLFDYPESYTVGFAGVPVSNLIMRMGHQSQSYQQLFSAKYHIGKTAQQDIKEYRRRSPSYNTHKLKRPLMVNGNTNDEDVVIEEVEDLIAHLKANNKTFEYKIYEDEPGGHMFDRIDLKSSKNFRLEMYKFLEKHLKPRYPFKNIRALEKSSYLFPSD